MSTPPSVTGMTDSREMRTSGKSLNAAVALISASVTGRGSFLTGATSTTAALPVLSSGSGYASPSAFAIADHRLLVAGVVVEDAIALLDGAQMLLRERVLHAAPDRLLVLDEARRSCSASALL